MDPKANRAALLQKFSASFFILSLFFSLRSSSQSEHNSVVTFCRPSHSYRLFPPPIVRFHSSHQTPNIDNLLLPPSPAQRYYRSDYLFLSEQCTPCGRMAKTVQKYIFFSSPSGPFPSSARHSSSFHPSPVHTLHVISPLSSRRKTSILPSPAVSSPVASLLFPCRKSNT